MNHKGRRMVTDGGYIKTRITNGELEKFRLNVTFQDAETMTHPQYSIVYCYFRL